MVRIPLTLCRLFLINYRIKYLSLDYHPGWSWLQHSPRTARTITIIACVESDLSGAERGGRVRLIRVSKVKFQAKITRNWLENSMCHIIDCGIERMDVLLVQIVL